MIREARLEDMDAVVRMGLRFAEERAEYDRVSVDPVHITTLAADLMASDSSVLLLLERPDGPRGMLGMFTYAHPFSGERVAYGLVWWVDPEVRGDGVRLLRAAEAWAKKRGAVVVQMAAPNGGETGEIYERLSYHPVETAFARRF